MANTPKLRKISATAFDKVMKETRVPITNIDWHGIEVAIKDTLPLRDVLAFVDIVSKSCFAIGTNEYIPEVKSFTIKCCVLEMYANFTLPTNVERKYDLIYNTDAFDIVCEHINIKQLNEIVSAINEKVDNIAQSNIEAVNKQMNELYAAFDGLQKQIENIFSGIKPDDISKLVETIADGKLDEDKLMQKYINLNPNEGE